MDTSAGQAPPVADLASWKEQARAGKAPADAILRKGYTADNVKAEADSRKITFTISTGAVDRDRDTLKAEGWQLDAFRANPVVLWAHDYRSLPVAKAESIAVRAGALKATADFVPADVSPFAETVYRMLKGGFLRATSVGFRPMEDRYKFNEDRGGFDFMEQELLEFSIVPVPANPQALMDAKAAGIDMAPLKGWAEAVLDGMVPGLWIPKTQALDVFRTLSESRVVVPAAFDTEPFVKAARSAHEKRGRVLSQANEDRIRRAQMGAEECASALAEVMGSMPMEPSDPMEEPKAALYVLPSTPKGSITADPEVIKAAVRAAVSDSVRGELNYARGRID